MLYRALEDALASAYQGDITDSTLQDQADTVHQVLQDEILDTLSASDKFEQALLDNLEILERLAVASRNAVTQSAKPGQSQGRGNDQGQGQQGTTIVNAKANGATARIHQDTWKGSASNIIDQDPNSQWQVAGNPDNILAFFTFPRRAVVTGDYIRIGTGGDQDVTRYEVYARDADANDWQTKRVVDGSVTGDGTPDANHTFESPLKGTEFALVITDHRAPELCYTSCDVPLCEYHLKGRYIG